jgi:hypothetical protein
LVDQPVENGGALSTCTCGHPADLHRHLRPGSECAEPRCGCQELRRRWFFRKVVPVPKVQSIDPSDSSAA